MTGLPPGRDRASALPLATTALSRDWVPRVWARGAVFLDYDGTLTPIVDRPELARLHPAVRDVVRQVADRCPVAVVSGRDLPTVRELVGLDELAYVGSHGLDIVGPVGSGWRHAVAEGHAETLEQAAAQLRRETEGVPGVFVEPKRFSISTHVRHVAADRHAEVDAAVGRVHRAHPTLRREGGKMLFELRPDVEWDKGTAVRWLLDRWDRSGDDAVYIGDDLTDETAFEALTPSGATTVLVSDLEHDRPTRARYRLPDPDAVRALLTMLATGPETLP